MREISFEIKNHFSGLFKWTSWKLNEGLVCLELLSPPAYEQSVEVKMYSIYCVIADCSRAHVRFAVQIGPYDGRVHYGRYRNVETSCVDFCFDSSIGEWNILTTGHSHEVVGEMVERWVQSKPKHLENLVRAFLANEKGPIITLWTSVPEILAYKPPIELFNLDSYLGEFQTQELRNMGLYLVLNDSEKEKIVEKARADGLATWNKATDEQKALWKLKSKEGMKKYWAEVKAGRRIRGKRNVGGGVGG